MCGDDGDVLLVLVCSTCEGVPVMCASWDCVCVTPMPGSFDEVCVMCDSCDGVCLTCASCEGVVVILCVFCDGVCVVVTCA